MCHLGWSLEWSLAVWNGLVWSGYLAEVVVLLFELVDAGYGSILDLPL